MSIPSSGLIHRVRASQHTGAHLSQVDAITDEGSSPATLSQATASVRPTLETAAGGTVRWRNRSNATLSSQTRKSVTYSATAAGTADVDNDFYYWTGLTGGTAYTVTVDGALSSSTANRNFLIAIEWLSATGFISSVSQVKAVANGTKVSFSLSATSPTNTTRARIILRMENAAAGNVATWTDLVVPSSWKEEGIIGHADFDLDGVDDHTSISGYTAPGASTYMYVLDPKASGVGQTLWLDGGLHELNWSSTGITLWHGGNGAEIAATISRDPQVWTAVFRDGTADLYINGTSKGSVTTGTGTPNNVAGRLFGHPSVSRPLSARVFEIDCWDHILTDDERSRAHSYVQNTYGITVADYKVSGDLTGSLPGITGDFSGSVTDTISGSLSGTIPALTATANGSVVVSGTVAGSLPALTGSIAASLTVTSTLSGSVPSLSCSIAASQIVEGSLSGSLPAVTSSITATVTVDGTLAGTIPALTGSFTANLSYDATLSGSVPALSASLNGSQTNSGSISGVLPALSVGISGSIAYSGSLSGTIPAVTADINGSQANSGSLAGTIPALTSSLTASVIHAGTITVGLPAITGSVDGAIQYVATLAGVIPLVTTSINGSCTIDSVLSGYLPPIRGDFMDATLEMWSRHPVAVAISSPRGTAIAAVVADATTTVKSDPKATTVPAIVAAATATSTSEGKATAIASAVAKATTRGV